MIEKIYNTFILIIEFIGIIIQLLFVFVIALVLSPFYIIASVIYKMKNM